MQKESFIKNTLGGIYLDNVFSTKNKMYFISKWYRSYFHSNRKSLEREGKAEKHSIFFSKVVLSAFVMQFVLSHVLMCAYTYT